MSPRRRSQPSPPSTSGRIPSPEQQVEFLLQIQRLLEEALFVASYKPALLIALAQVAVERGRDGEALDVTTRQLAERFVRLYWRQARPYASGHGRDAAILRQTTGNQAALVNDVAAARERHAGSLSTFQLDDAAWRRLLGKVARTIAVMPLWKLQTVGTERLDFLYDNLDRGHTITLKPTAVFCLRRFQTLVVELAQNAWVRFLRGVRQNAPVLGDAQDLREFLFGSDRASLRLYRMVLHEAQSGRCFYCDRGVAIGRAVVDHFIPWARYPVDLGHGLVLADERCNTHKRDRLAARPHLEAWAERNATRGPELAERFDAAALPHDLDASWQIASWAYTQGLAAGASAWERGSRTTELMQPIAPDWLRILPGAA